MEAEIRNRYGKETRELKKEIKAMEDKMARLETEQEALDVKLADTEFYQKPEAQEAIQRHGEVSRELETALEAWTEKSERFEKLNAQIEKRLRTEV